MVFLPFLFFLSLGCESKKGNTAGFELAYGLLVPGAPKVLRVIPPSGPDVGGTTVIVEGSGFRDGAQVTFDGRPATNVRVLDPSRIQCVTPPGREGWVDVGVRNADGRYYILSKGFRYVRFFVDPNHAPPAGGVRAFVHGENFVSGMQVLFGQNNPALNVQVLSSSLIELKVPASPTGGEAVVDVYIIYPNGDQVVLRNGFSYTLWSFETPDNAATDVRGMTTFGPSDTNRVTIAVGLRGLVNIKIGSNDWQYVTIDPVRDAGGVGGLNYDNQGNVPDFLGVHAVRIPGSPDNYYIVIVGEQEVVLYKTVIGDPSALSLSDWATGWVIAQNTQTSTVEYNDVHGVNAGGTPLFFIAGDQGYVARFDASAPSLLRIRAPYFNNLYGVFVVNAGEVLFCGSSARVLYFNGDLNNPVWRNIDVSSAYYAGYYGPPVLYDIAVVENRSGTGGNNRVYIVGEASYPSSYSYYRIPTIIELVGDNGNYPVVNRMTQKDVSNYTYRHLYAIVARADGDAYACGSGPTIFQLIGSEWYAMPFGSKYWHPSTSSRWTYFATTGYDDGNQFTEVFVGGTKGRIMHHYPAGTGTGVNQPHMWFYESGGSAASGQVIQDIHANAWNNVWIVGTGGLAKQGVDSNNTIQYLNHGAGTNKGLLSTDNLYGVWTAGPGFTIAVGDDGSGRGVIFFWDGQQWHRDSSTNPRAMKLSQTGTTLRDVYGTDPDNIWVCGDGGLVYKWDPQSRSWVPDALNQNGQPLTQNDLLGIFASKSSSTTRVVVVGRNGTGLIYEKTTWSSGWTTATTGTTNDLYAVHGSSTYSMYAVGDNGTVLRVSTWGTWSSVTLPSAVSQINFRAVHMNDIDDIYVTGAQGTMVRYEGYPVSSWQVLRSPVQSTSTIYSIFGVDSNEMFLADGGKLYRGHSHWVVQVVRTFTIRSYYSATVFVKQGYEYWVVASDGTSARRVLGRWQRLETQTSRALYSIWYSPTSEYVYTVGSGGTALYFNTNGSTSWSNMSPTTYSTLFWVSGIPGTGVYVVGTNRTIYIGPDPATSLTQANVLAPSGSSGSSWDWLLWVGGFTTNNLWAIGDRSAIKYDSGTGDWIAQGSSIGFNPSYWFNHAWVDPATGNVFAVGYYGMTGIYNRASNRWTIYSFAGGNYSTLWWVWGSSSNDVWAVGNSGTIVHWNGSQWTKVANVPTTKSLYCIWGEFINNNWEVYACGMDGTLLKRVYTNSGQVVQDWTQEPISTDLDFWFITGLNGRIIVGSEFGTVLVR